MLFKKFGSMNGMLIVCFQIIVLVIIYDALSIGLTFYQKYFIKEFHFPLTIIIGHVIFKFMYALIIRRLLYYALKRGNIYLDPSLYFKALIPTGILSGLDIGLSNWSFEFITVSLYTMSKSSCIIFIFLFSLLLKLNTLKISNVLSVLLIASGLFLFTFHSTQFNWKGFTLVMIAAMVGGARWSFAQLVTQHQKHALKNPLDVIYYIQPWMLAILTPLAIIFERDLYKSLTDGSSSHMPEKLNPMQIVSPYIFKIFIGSLIAFGMEISEYLLIMQTSGLTLGISGIAKEIVTLYLAAKFNGDEFSKINLAGLLICLLGISLHVGMSFKRPSTKGKEDNNVIFHRRPLRRDKSDPDSRDGNDTARKHLSSPPLVTTTTITYQKGKDRIHNGGQCSRILNNNNNSNNNNNQELNNNNNNAILDTKKGVCIPNDSKTQKSLLIIPHNNNNNNITSSSSSALSKIADGCEFSLIEYYKKLFDIGSHPVLPNSYSPLNHNNNTNRYDEKYMSKRPLLFTPGLNDSSQSSYSEDDDNQNNNESSASQDERDLKMADPSSFLGSCEQTHFPNYIEIPKNLDATAAALTKTTNTEKGARSKIRRLKTRKDRPVMARFFEYFSHKTTLLVPSSPATKLSLNDKKKLLSSTDNTFHHPKYNSGHHPYPEDYSHYDVFDEIDPPSSTFSTEDSDSENSVDKVFPTKSTNCLQIDHDDINYCIRNKLSLLPPDKLERKSKFSNLSTGEPVYRIIPP